MEGKTINDMPTEILLNIFCHLQMSDLKNNIPKVCCRWADIAVDGRLWRHANLVTISKTTKTFGVRSWYSTLRFLETTPQLCCLTISQGHSNDEVIEILNSISQNCPNIRQIEFQVNIRSSVQDKLKEMSESLRNLEVLKLKLVSTPSLKSLYKTLSRFKQLKKVEFLDFNPDHRDFEEFLSQCEAVEDLNFSNDDFCSTHFRVLCKFKLRFVTLSLQCDFLTESCLEELASFPNLKRLSLSDGMATPGKLAVIGRMRMLKSLLLREDAASPVLSATSLTNFLRTGTFDQLRELRLHKSRLNDDGAAEIRRNCKELRYLEVMMYPRDPSQLTDIALLHFLHCRVLEYLEIISDNSGNTDWIYRRKRYTQHGCAVDEDCPEGLDVMLECWDELQIPVD